MHKPDVHAAIREVPWTKAPGDIINPRPAFEPKHRCWSLAGGKTVDKICLYNHHQLYSTTLMGRDLLCELISERGMEFMLRLRTE